MLVCLICWDVMEEWEVIERLVYLVWNDVVIGLLNCNGFEYFVGEMLMEVCEDGC